MPYKNTFVFIFIDQRFYGGSEMQTLQNSVLMPERYNMKKHKRLNKYQPPPVTRFILGYCLVKWVQINFNV